MSDTTNTIERAYQIAKSGSCRTVEQIIYQLNREHFEGAVAHLTGAGIRKTLKDLMATAVKA